MKKFIGLVIIAIIGFGFSFPKTVNQGAEGIKFKHVTLEEAKKLAKETERLIFIDAYTTWCGPCKRMAATTFRDEKVATYFNKNFICLKIDAENDKDGPEMVKSYRVQVYPTLLFINENGKLVKTLEGFQDADKLMTIAKSLN